jgi:hypothetical protein
MNSPNPTQHDPWLEIVLKLLDWPFLLSIVLFTFLCLFRRPLTALLSRSDIELSWGEGRSIRLRDLGDNLDKELDPLRDEVEALKQAAPPVTTAEAAKEGAPTPLTSEPRADAQRVMIEALANPKFRWRSIERLAAIANLPQPEAAELLRFNPDVVFSIGKSKQPIARLKTR